MTTRTACTPWLDRFNQPSLEALLGNLREDVLPQVEAFRERMRALHGVREQVEWLGLPWRWAIAYTAVGHPVSRAVAYLVPDPESMRISIPLEQDVLALIAGPKASRTLRDSIVQASRVGQIVWPEWTMGSVILAEELAGVAEAKLVSFQPKRENAPETPTAAMEPNVVSQHAAIREQAGSTQAGSKRSKPRKGTSKVQQGAAGAGEPVTTSTASL